MPRISVECPKRLHIRLQRVFPWGTMAPALRRVTELLCDKIEKDGIVVLEMLISGQYDPLDGLSRRERITKT